MNFKDLLNRAFNIELGEDINWNLLPLGASPPIDPIDYISSSRKSQPKAAVRQYLSELAKATREVNNAGQDTGRLLTVFNIKLQSTKKIRHADAIVEVGPGKSTKGPLAIERRVDPNISHPLRQKDAVSQIGTLHGKPFTSHTFQAIVWKYQLREQPHYCWRATGGLLTKYSQDVVTFMKRLTQADIQAALADYRSYLARRRRGGS